VELDELLSAMDRTAANLAKLDDVWGRAASFIPDGPSAGSAAEYDDLCRAWSDLLSGLPPIDGWTITGRLPDIDAVGRAFIDYAEIGEPPFAVYEEAGQPGKDLAEYRYRFNRARRRAARERLQQLMATIDVALSSLLDGIPRDSQERLEGPAVDEVTAAILPSAPMSRLVPFRTPIQFRCRTSTSAGQPLVISRVPRLSLSHGTAWTTTVSSGCSTTCCVTSLNTRMFNG
jgi:hypothetical protein